MFEIVFFAAISVIACVALYYYLGKSVGRGPDDRFEPDSIFGGGREAPARRNNAVVAEPAVDDGTGLSAVVAAEPGFSPAEFIDGAKSAYSMILEAFASGDRETLGELLTADVYAVYDAAITEREASNLTQVTDLGRLRTTQIKSARIEDGMAIIRVLYEADLASALMDDQNNLVEGDPDMLASISEYWTYERAVGSSDPAWRLADVEPSEGDALPADPTPDTSGPETAAPEA